MRKINKTMNNNRRVTPMRNSDIPSPQDPFDRRASKSKPNSRAVSPTGRARPHSDLFATQPIEANIPLPKISNPRTPNNEFISSSNIDLITPLIHSKTCSVTMERMNIQIEKKQKLDVDFDEFFLSLNDTPIWQAVETFITSQIRGTNAIYWQENSTLNSLYCPKYKKIFPHSKSLVGFAFFQRDFVRIPIAKEHPMYDLEIDSQVVSPLSTILMFPLFDFSNSLVAIVEVVRRGSNDDFLNAEEQLLRTFQRKFQAFSKWILEQKVCSFLPQMMTLMTIEQFILDFQKNMRVVFGCSTSEIWERSEKNNTITRYDSIIESIDPNNCGIVNDILSKAQIYNTLNCKYSSSYSEDIDGGFDTVLALPIFDTFAEMSYAFVLRGKRTGIFTVDDETKLRDLSEMLIIGFKNAKSISNPDSQSNVVSSLIKCLPKPHESLTSKEILSQMMTSLQEHTKADRSTFYIVDKPNNEIVSIYCPGIRKAIRMSIGSGHSGLAAETGFTLNTADAYHDTDFNACIDSDTHYETKTLLTVPILDSKGESISVIQLINKNDSRPFSKYDAGAAKIYGTICSCLMENASLKAKYDDLDFHSHQLQSIIDTFDFVKIVNVIKDTIQCEKSDIFIFDEAANLLLPLTNKKEDPININEDFFGKCFQNNQTFFTNYSFMDKRLDGMTNEEKAEYKSFYISTLSIRNGKKYGILRIVNKKGEFTENNINHLKMFTFVITIMIERIISLDLIDKGKIQVDILKYITTKEYGKCIVPAHFQPSPEDIEKITSLNFRTFNCDKHKLYQIVFYAFDVTGIMKAYKITNNKLYRFIHSIESKYMDIPYHNWMKAVDVLQYFLYEFHTAQLNTIFNNIDITAILISALCSFIGNDGTNDKFQILAETPISLLYPRDRILETDQCSTAIQLMRDPLNDILELANEYDNLKIWKLVVKLLLETNIDKPTKLYAQFNDILRKSMCDLNNELHRNLIITFLFKAAIASPYCRDFEIAEEIREKEKEEMIRLGNEEIKRKVEYSSPHNCVDMYSAEKLASERRENVLPSFKYVAKVFADLKPAYLNAKNNFNKWTTVK
ncbi:hypothetical protein TRFO_21203 [Tritrichomonas foetus]|uniref:PDEase domain-containing protein n=1 Tax=Tritrichomonas foetus TaxID=1144522 RepID=A0A1J4KJB6_9EUKA|nr:hypothetical protein TRFO_21203 [Tritrichomonas foetus]|eukprot:OHT09774.1 hypothetical protein TRFO_21203 [Tritrichomonas foetus]